MTVVSLDKVRQARMAKAESPDPAHVFVDGDGQTWFEYSIGYQDGPRELFFSLWAISEDDARRRLELIGRCGFVDGQVMSVIDGE